MAIYEKYLEKSKFSGEKDFIENLKFKPIEENFNFAFDVVDELGRTKPDKLALLYTNDRGDEGKFTFKDIMENSNKAANYFKSIGVKKGDAVMLILKRHYEFWFCIMGLHKLGAICIPATNLLTKKDLLYRFDAASIKMCVCTAEGNISESVDAAQQEYTSLEYKVLVGGKRNGKELTDGWICFEDGMDAASVEFTRPEGEDEVKAKDISLLYFTSGTTGNPKMVQHDFTYPIGHIITAAYWHNAIDGGMHFTIAETGWAKSVWGKLYGQWFAETAVFVYEFDKFIPNEMLRVMEKYNITTFCAPPTMFRFFIKEDLKKYDLSSLKYCTIAGEPLNPEVYNQFLNATGMKLMEGFGQTESTVFIFNSPWMEPKPGSMGKPSPVYDVDIVNDKNESCPIGEVGEIVIRTEKMKPVGMFSGYYRDHERTESVWYDDIYHTGDTAWKDEDGYFWFVGRTDDLIKSSGYRIGPFEVESALMEHSAVLETAITAVPDEIRGQVVKATIVLAKGYAPSEELKKELQEHVKKVTAPYKYPRIIEFVEELPKTISGKIRRVEIRENDDKQL